MSAADPTSPFWTFAIVVVLIVAYAVCVAVTASRERRERRARFERVYGRIPRPLDRRNRR